MLATWLAVSFYRTKSSTCLSFAFHSDSFTLDVYSLWKKENCRYWEEQQPWTGLDCRVLLANLLRQHLHHLPLTFISTVRCSIHTPTRRFPIHPIQSIQSTYSTTVLHPSLTCYNNYLSLKPLSLPFPVFFILYLYLLPLSISLSFILLLAPAPATPATNFLTLSAFLLSLIFFFINLHIYLLSSG